MDNANEILMRQHGLLSRLLLIYERMLEDIGISRVVPAHVLVKTTGLISSYVQELHERLEERYVFRALKDANRLSWLVDVLFNQHIAGRQLIAEIRELGPMSADERGRDLLAERMRQFLRMYRPHAAREDTELFPAFREVVPARRFRQIAGECAERERELFGKQAFAETVGRTAELEAELGINQITAFTPDIPFKPVIYPP